MARNQAIEHTASNSASLNADAVRLLLEVSTSADAVANLEKVRDLEAEAVNDFDRLHAQRGALMLGGSDDELDTLERQAAAAGRRRDRLSAAAERLRALADELAAEEQRTKARAAIAEARQGMDQYPDLLTAYADAAHSIRELIGKAAGINAAVDIALRLAETAGIPKAEIAGLSYPAAAMSTPDESVTKRVYLGDVAHRPSLPDRHKGLPPEEIPSNYQDQTTTISGKRVLNLSDPGGGYRISLPDPWGGSPIVSLGW
ncbi:hypothetical protein [uncultured Thiodictyon sp.]|uniref:hypothetical protein n=1 Tax=uncultured Thiodictyon sp. TaxID=1846217 RepID=UPI0025D81917|nr:hypothetical protein [uncultured Thiodictyon sp.]